jgi:NitT/TauT family transport system substrate-binding protein
MATNRSFKCTRREFLKWASVVTSGSLLAANINDVAAVPALETTKVRLVHAPSICVTPQYLAETFLRADGFSEIQYLPLGSRNGPYAIADGRADIGMWDAPGLMPPLDAVDNLVVLAGVHSGCYELFANESIWAVRDLKNKTIAIQYFNGGDHILMSGMLAYVGIDPRHEVNWIAGEHVRDAMDLFVEGRADAFLGFAQQPAELRQKGAGHMILDTAQDRPWSQYFCCMIVANRQFVERNPVATKHIMRAILKGADPCAEDPTSAARFLANKLYEPRFKIGFDVMSRVPYGFWRVANPEDTIRFHALRLYEVGMLKTRPDELIARGTNFRFLDELKKELKA